MRYAGFLLFLIFIEAQTFLKNATATTPGNKCSGLWATTRTKGRQAFIAIVRALKASQALGRAALTGRGGTPARLC